MIRHAGAQSAAVIGHDWGGSIAWQVALRHRERVDGLAALAAPHPAAFQHLTRPQAAALATSSSSSCLGRRRRRFGAAASRTSCGRSATIRCIRRRSRTRTSRSTGARSLSPARSRPRSTATGPRCAADDRTRPECAPSRLPPSSSGATATDISALNSWTVARGGTTACAWSASSMQATGCRTTCGRV